MVTDSLSDLIARIKNGYRSGSGQITAPWTKTGEQVSLVLVQTGYISSAIHQDNQLVITLKYTDKDPALTDIVRVSKPGSRAYRGYRDIPPVWGGIGRFVISTPQGIVSDIQARKLKVGGEVICKVW